MYSRLRNRISSVYFNRNELSEEQYRSSQHRLILSGASGNILYALTTGSFLAGYLSHLGASNEFCAIVGSIAQFGCILQMFSPYIFEKLRNRKLLICICCFIFRFSLGTVIFVPFLVHGQAGQLTVVAVIETIAFLVAGFVTPGWNNWNLSIAPTQKRGRYLAVKDVVSMISVALISLGAGKLLDYFSSINNVFQGFFIIFTTALVLSVLDFLLASSMMEPKVDFRDQKFTLRQIITEPLQNQSFRPLILFLSIWSFAIQFSASFIPVYMVTDLKLSYSFISAVTMAGNILGMAAAFFWGNLADRTTWSFILKISGSCIAACYFGWFFVYSNNAAALVPILQILLSCCNGAFSMASLNLQFALAPKVGRTAYLGVTSAISSVISFTGTLLGSAVSGLLHSVRIRFWGMEIGNIQILFLITSIVLVFSLFVHKKLHISAETN